MANDNDLYAPPTPEELKALRSNPAARVEAPDLFAPPTKEELAAIRGPQKGLTERAVTGVASAIAPVALPIARTVDRFTGAPVRSAIGAVQDGNNPAMAFMNQFGGDPENAPTGKEIAKKAGVGETTLSEVVPSLYSEDGSGWKLRKGGLLDPTASGAVGLGIDAVSDPLNLVGVGEIASFAKAGGKIGINAAGKAIKGGSIFADAVTGTKAATRGVEATKSAAIGAGKIADNVKTAIDSAWKPSVAPDAASLKAIAKKHGIAEEFISPAHEFGERSAITRSTRTLAEGATGEKHLKAHNDGMLQTTGALEKDITIKFGQPPAMAKDAGETISKAADSHVSRVFEDADITYSSAAKQFPGLTINKDAMAAMRSKAVGFKREAMRLERTTRNPTQLAQAKNLREWSELILSKTDNGPGTYKEMSEVIQNVGKAAFERTPVGQIPPDTKKLMELYNIGSESLIHSIRKVDQNAADRLIVNNAEIREMLTDKNTLGKIVKSSDTEDVYNSLVKNGGSSQIEVLKKILSPEDFNKVRGKYLHDLVKYFPEESGAASINFKATRGALERNKEKLQYLFRPEELKDMGELIQFGERFGNPVMSSSGTGGSSGLRGFAKNLVAGSQDEAAVEYMKAKARGKIPPVSAPASVPPAAAGSVPPAGSAPAAVPPPSPRPKYRGMAERGPGEQRLKALQTVAPSTYKRPTTADEEPKKGRDKWVNDGLEKLRQHSRDPASIDALKETLMKDERGRDLLIRAGDLTPGSKAMDRLIERMREHAASPVH